MKKIEKRQWVNFSIWGVLYILFCIWVENLWLLIGLIVFVDIYLTKYIPWGAWKKSKNKRTTDFLEWVDDILFALVAVYVINLFLFQNYQIPSSSLEKSLLVGDYLFVSKASYGPRMPNTPLSFPLVQNTLPFLNCKSYFDWPEWGYKRLKGFGSVKRYDIVVFNFPAGDTVALKQPNPDYYTMVDSNSREIVKEYLGPIIYRPVDKRENFVKRCIGMPGDSLLIRDNQVYINGQAAENPEDMQLNYYIETDGSVFTEDLFRKLEVSKIDRVLASADGGSFLDLQAAGFTMNENGLFNPIYRLPLTKKALAVVKQMPTVKQVKVEKDDSGSFTYPIGYRSGWSRDNYGPLWIPKKGMTIELNEWNLALYGHCICNYEHNQLEVQPGGKALINGQPASSYTFQYDYYFMMGDNRHKSSDSRSWGFVPEDHIVGKPILIWLSIDKDYNLFNGGLRWKRMFRMVHSD
ncbi:MAG: signal peptidase I [Tannerella sp.]|jgi:signal peptidase I|nr:signal peptidase I [Tannerella sp.]